MVIGHSCRITEIYRMTEKYPPQSQHLERTTVNILLVSIRFLFELEMYVRAYLKQGNKPGIIIYLQFCI